MGGKIDAYIDCVSPYSFFAFEYLLENRKALESYNVEIEYEDLASSSTLSSFRDVKGVVARPVLTSSAMNRFHPVFLGGINVGSGNTPPWMLPAKANYLAYDRQRSQSFFKRPNLRTPDSFPILSLLPQRAMGYVKSSYPRDKYEAAFAELWVALWEQNMDVSKPEILSSVLQRNFSQKEAEQIIKEANQQKWKQTLNDKTKEALDRGAFGAPWLWVKNLDGKEEPFFGSDRFTWMWRFLGLQVNDLEIVPKTKAKM